MKYGRIFFIAIFCSISSWSSWSSSFGKTPSKNQKHPVLQCLGLQEEKFHREKITDIFFRLNQDLLIEFIPLHNIPLRGNFTTIICQAPNPSIQLLYLSVREQEKLFQLRSSGHPLYLDEKKFITEYAKKSVDMFINFMGLFQSKLERKNCYQEKYPAIYQFLHKIQRLGGSEFTQENIGRSKELLKVVEYFKDPDKMIEECRNQKL